MNHYFGLATREVLENEKKEILYSTYTRNNKTARLNVRKELNSIEKRINKNRENGLAKQRANENAFSFVLSNTYSPCFGSMYYLSKKVIESYPDKLLWCIMTLEHHNEELLDLLNSLFNNIKIVMYQKWDNVLIGTSEQRRLVSGKVESLLYPIKDGFYTASSYLFALDVNKNYTVYSYLAMFNSLMEMLRMYNITYSTYPDILNLNRENNTLSLESVLGFTSGYTSQGGIWTTVVPNESVFIKLDDIDFMNALSKRYTKSVLENNVYGTVLFHDMATKYFK